MFYLAIIITVLAHGPHGHPKTHHLTTRLPYDTSHTCESAQEQTDVDLILHATKGAIRVRTDCEPLVDGPYDDWGRWDFPHRMFRS